MTAFLFTLACTSVSLRFSWLARSEFTLNMRYLLHNIQETNPHSTAILPPEHQNRISINYEHASEWPLAEKTFVSTATNIHFLLHSIAISSTSMEKHSKRFKREYTAYRRKCSWKSDYSLTNPHARLEPSIPVPGRAPAGLQPTNAHVHAHLGDARVAPVILAILNVNYGSR